MAFRFARCCVTAGAVLTISKSVGSGPGTPAAHTVHLTADQWADHVCRSVTTWAKYIQSSSDNFKPAEVGAKSVPEAKAILVNFLDGAVVFTSTMISDVQSAGAPDVPHGTALAAGLVRGLQQVQTAFTQARNQCQQLAVDNTTALLTQAQTIGRSLDNAGREVSVQLNAVTRSYPFSDLDAAFKNQAACQSLIGASGSS